MEREEQERLIDVLDIGTRAAEHMVSDATALSSRLAAPEQEFDENGRPTVTECVDCGTDLDERALIGKIRCIRCQEALEKRRRGFFRVTQCEE